MTSEAVQKHIAFNQLHAFLYLQALDLLTTLVGLKLGLMEASPFVRLLMGLGPAAGVAGSKVIAVALAAVALRLEKPRLLRWVNYWYALLVVWNLCMILFGG